MSKCLFCRRPYSRVLLEQRLNEVLAVKADPEHVRRYVVDFAQFIADIYLLLILALEDVEKSDHVE